MTEENRKVNQYVNELNKKYCWANHKNLDKFYSLNKKSFDHIKQIYKDVEPSFIIQFGIILPIDNPFGENEFSTFKIFEDNNKLGFSFHFDTLKEKSFFYIGKPLKYRKAFETYRTRCEISIVMKSSIIKIDDKIYEIEKDMKIIKQAKLKNEEDLLSFYKTSQRVFTAQKYLQQIAIDDLNEVLLNYAFISEDDNICSINRDNIEFASLFRGISVSNWETYNWMTVHNVQAYPREHCSNFDKEIFGHSLLNRLDRNLFFEFKRNLQDSRYLLSKGSTVESLIKMNTSIEVLLTQILALYWANEEDLEIDVITKKIDDVPFKKKITVELPKILGGTWDITKKGKPLNEWYESSYLLRNRIVHGGYMPKMEEVYNSQRCCYNFINYVIDLMNKSKYEYLHGLNSVEKLEIKTMKL